VYPRHVHAAVFVHLDIILEEMKQNKTAPDANEKEEMKKYSEN